MTPPGLYPFEALAEIFDFVAGLVQRVPKKPNEIKADLQNSTASQGDCSWEIYSSLRLWKQDASATNPNQMLCFPTASPNFNFPYAKLKVSLQIEHNTNYVNLIFKSCYALPMQLL